MAWYSGIIPLYHGELFLLIWFEEWHMFVEFGIDANKLMSIIACSVGKLDS